MSERVCVVLPALNEADALPAALAGRPSDVRIVVVDNGSTDGTAEVAIELGVEVVNEPQRGFGAACRRGLDASNGSEIVVFMDADATCDWADLESLVKPIAEDGADLVLGRRDKVLREAGAMPWHVAVANRVLGFACGRLANAQVRDVPPYRAARRSSLLELQLQDSTYGWPLEMILLAGKAGQTVVEVPVAYRVRVGTSKVTGTVTGTLRATSRMFSVLWKYRR